MMNVNEILNYKRKEEEDYYAILGCDENSTVEQITTEYKVRALQCHPDKNDGDKEAEQKFQLLKEAKEILCDPEKRANYDKWRNSGISISYKQWLGMKEHVHQSMHWSTPKTKDRMLETGGSSGPSSLGAGGISAAQRRASEGGANLHWGGKGTGSAWGSNAPSESTQWADFKSQEKILASGGSSGPSSLTAGIPSTAYRRASEGGPNLYMKLASKKAAEKNNEI
ncbi:J domain-containing protein isoform X1 [Tribolium madens]|uniref:J domain-containing protein isoform X1 n=1 Tax=Tribolium madens TaxID=41895 RepID=UPI001CF74E03|nr:J domain-containing protein isoform X1 [Tribolium madens]